MRPGAHSGALRSAPRGTQDRKLVLGRPPQSWGVAMGLQKGQPSFDEPAFVMKPSEGGLGLGAGSGGAGAAVLPACAPHSIICMS